MMQSEEYLTHYDSMRSDRDDLRELSTQMTNLAEERKRLIEQIIDDHKQAEQRRLEGKKEMGVQVNVTTYGGGSGRGKDQQMASSRGSGSI